MATGLMVITMATGVPIIATKTPQQKAPAEADASAERFVSYSAADDHRTETKKTETDSQTLTWMCLPTSIIGAKADMARTCQYDR